MATLSHYDILGVAPDANEAVIRQAYKAALLHHHPDKSGTASDLGTDAFQRLQLAWQVR